VIVVAAITTLKRGQWGRIAAGTTAESEQKSPVHNFFLRFMNVAALVFRYTDCAGSEVRADSSTRKFAQLFVHPETPADLGPRRTDKDKRVLWSAAASSPHAGHSPVLAVLLCMCTNNRLGGYVPVDAPCYFLPFDKHTVFVVWHAPEIRLQQNGSSPI
jgi:hypothetical protein